MITSESIKEITAALVKSQLEYPPIGKDRTAKTEKFSYDYADYSHVLDKLRPVLNKNGIAIIQGSEAAGNIATVTTRLAHVSGEWIESKLSMQAESAAPQKLGSAISYCRRYGCLSLAGAMPREEDEDGAEAGKPEPVKASYPKESGTKAGEAMKKAVAAKAPVVPMPPNASGAPQRKADALAYLWNRYGEADLDIRNTLAKLLGRTFPIKDDIKITLDELEKLEAEVRRCEQQDSERGDN